MVLKSVKRVFIELEHRAFDVTDGIDALSFLAITLEIKAPVLDAVAPFYDPNPEMEAMRRA